MTTYVDQMVNADYAVDVPIGDFVTTDEAAERLGVKRITVLKAIERGKLKAKRIGQQYFIHKDEVSRYLRERKSPGRPRTKRGYNRNIGD